MNNIKLRERQQELNYKIAMKAGHSRRLQREAKELDKEIDQHLLEIENLGE